MFSEFFGNYLLNKGIISGPELVMVLTNQKKCRLQLGILAINAGYMTAEQVEAVHKLQAQKDRRFGEIAVIEMYLNPIQLDKLLKEQQSEHLLLAQALIEADLMNMESFQLHLNAYKQDFELSDNQFEALKNGHVDQVIGAFLKFSENSPRADLKEYITLFYKNMIRFIDTSVHIEMSKPAQEKTYPCMVSQRIFGMQKYYTGIAGELDVMLKIAEINAGEKFETMDEFALDSVAEYLNLHNGLFLVNMSDKHINLHMSVQKAESNKLFTPEDEIYIIPFVTSFGKFDLIVGRLNDIE